MSLEINHTHYAKMLLALDKMASDIGIEQKSVAYYDKLEELADEVMDSLTKIWEES